LATTFSIGRRLSFVLGLHPEDGVGDSDLMEASVLEPGRPGRSREEDLRAALGLLVRVGVGDQQLEAQSELQREVASDLRPPRPRGPSGPESPPTLSPSMK
jgi:hypothetical protein